VVAAGALGGGGVKEVPTPNPLARRGLKRLVRYWPPEAEAVWLPAKTSPLKGLESQ
jgi:hypothetical protein